MAERYAPELAENDPTVITAVAPGITEMLHRLTGFLREERRSIDVLLRFHDSLVSRNRQPADPERICMRNALWGEGTGGTSWASSGPTDRVR